VAKLDHIIPFLKSAEGKLSKDASDSASKTPVPDGSGYHTNQGVTWATWVSIFGASSYSIKRFYAMSDEDYYKCIVPFWNSILGDQIKSQRIADIIFDWVWGSGKYYPEIYIQDILINSFNQHIKMDGDFGQETINSINTVNEQAEYEAIIVKRFWYFDHIVIAHPSQKKFLEGWKNRVKNLIAFSK